MKATIDSAGRIVIPKKIREAAGLLPGVSVNIRVVESRIELEPEPPRMRIVRKGFLHVAEPLEPVSPMSRDEVQNVIDEIREERFRQILGLSDD